MSSTTVKPLKVFKSACGFRRAAALLKEPYKNGEYNLLFPFTTNLAFAAELFMKCLLYLDAVSVRKHHKLKQLFRSLSKTHQERITEFFEEEVKKKPYITKVEATEPNFKFEIDKVLEATDNSFDEWRYIYEEDQKNTVLFSGWRSSSMPCMLTC